MSLDHIPDLQCLMVMNGTVFGHLIGDPNTQPLEMQLGDALLPFETCDQDPTNAIEAGTTYPLDVTGLAMRSFSDPYEEVPGNIYACWVDHLTDWSLPDAETIQVMINRYQSPCQIHFKNKISVPDVHPKMFFEARLAVHRAAANLILLLKDPTSGQQERHEIPFDTQFYGGPLRSGYAHVKRDIPSHFACCEATFEIHYKHHMPDDKGIEPFVFLTDVRIAGQSTSSTVPLVEPEWLYGTVPEIDGHWIKAQLPRPLATREHICVNVGALSYPIAPVEKPPIHVRENYGHTLICEVPEPQQILLCIDRKPMRMIELQSGDNILRLPNDALTGHVRHLSLKDRSGTFTLFEQHQLMPAIVTPEDVMRREAVAPFPSTLFAQTALRYAGLKALLAHATPQLDFDQLAFALATLEGGHENVVLRPLQFPKVDAPDVSIVMPAHNKIAVTYLALCSLLLAHNDASFEVIVIDDASIDETARLEEIVSGITVLHQRTPQRFIRACNLGAARARGRYIALLNNDVEVTVGWLDELIAAFSRFKNVGLVGSKLLYPNGQLQEAGGIVWGSGNPWNYGKGHNPNEPRFSYARQADYLSGAALLLPMKVWERVGGLSNEMEPMYFEDTDLAFKVRAEGFTTWFIPSSVVYHYEGMTAGTGTTNGFKKFQEVNRPKFKRKWANAFANHGEEGRNPDLEKDRGIVGRVLFVDYAPPRADKDAGSYAALQEMRLVQSLGYKVSFISTNMAHLGSYTETLQNRGIEVIYAPFYMSAAEYLDRHAAEFDAFYITRYYVAQAVLQKIRSRAPKAKVLFNNADLHFLRELRAAKNSMDEDKLNRARQTRNEEMDIIQAADVALSYTEIEHSVIQAYTDAKTTVVKCPWVVDVIDDLPPLATRSGLSFLGSFRHHPNTEGVLWFANNIMPLLEGKAIDTPLSIYGSAMGEDIRALASSVIRPIGFVENIADAYHPHRIAVAPLLSGAGIKGKVLSALAHGIPCVISPLAAEGIGLRSGHDCFIVDTREEWVGAIDKLSRDDVLWHDISQNARLYMQQAFSFGRGREMMRAAFEAADMYGSRP
ncbi:MAG: glycosyltransferase [Pseudomonadota bacterium]